MEAAAFAASLPRNRPEDVRTTSISEVNFTVIFLRSSALESEKGLQRDCDRQRILA